MSEFTESLHDVFEEFGLITIRKMFGGHGVFHNGFMFGLVANDELFLKVDGQIKSEFVERGLPAFEYSKNGKLVKMSYHLVPDDIYDNKKHAREWAEKSYAAALRAGKKRKK